jgi:hypothetical protein
MAKHERKHRETGGVNEAEEDIRINPEARTNAKKIDDEAEERKKGGRAKRKRGGRMPEDAKHVEVRGEHEHKRADRKPRKDGGRTGADSQPFSSARKGTPAPGRKEQMQFEGSNEP